MQGSFRIIGLTNARMYFVSHHESIPEGDAAIHDDDSNSAGDVGTPANNTGPGGNHAEGS
jgi:hypothetical protein